MASEPSHIYVADDQTASTPDNPPTNSRNRTPSLIRSSNDIIAANLSTAIARTPQRVVSNTSKKRKKLPSLSRLGTSPSHSEKISTIFRDASAKLQGVQTSPCTQLTNIRGSRLPLSQARRMKFGTAADDSSTTQGLGIPSSPLASQSSCVERSQTTLNAAASTDIACPSPLLPAHYLPTSPYRPVTGDPEKEPISSGFTTPSALCSHLPRTPEEVRTATCDRWILPQSSSVDGSISKYVGQARRSAPPALSPAILSDAGELYTAGIEDWLYSIDSAANDSESREAPQTQTSLGSVVTPRTASSLQALYSKDGPQRSPLASSELGYNPQSPSRSSSNKENVSPSRPSPSPTRSSIIFPATTPLRILADRTQTSEVTAARQFTHLVTPQGHLSLPPKRKKSRVTGATNPNSAEFGKDFTIHDDQLADALAQLSPDVELHRKGRRRKRERCVSYWDEDILPPSSPCLPSDGSNHHPMRKGKRVLGESQQSAELTKEEPFVAEAENAQFDFQVQ